MADSEKPEARTVRVEMFKGGETPSVEVKDGDDLWIALPEEDPEVSGHMVNPQIKSFDNAIGISLRSLKVDLQNQSYGMISASTGCISNPGGPSC